MDEPVSTNLRSEEEGGINVDLLAQDQAGQNVVIENQLECTNHDHLGKLITYLTFFEAKTAIWIVKDYKPEHLNAVVWLNESGLADFYLVKVEAIKIDDSPAAPLLTMITGPSEEALQAGQAKQLRSASDGIKKHFWTDFLTKAKGEIDFLSNISATHHSWLGSGSGLPRGLGYNFSFRKIDGQVEMYIDAGKDESELNRHLFAQLHEQKDSIEHAFGDELLWEVLENRRACRIRKIIDIGGFDDEDKWPEIHQVMIEAMKRMTNAFKPHLENLRQ